eukprot:SAG25_NODE_11134_length_313_cov_0.420561_1_plen_53_part_10
MIRRPPRPTLSLPLFPYTTRLRSRMVETQPELEDDVDVVVVEDIGLAAAAAI